MTRSDSVWSVYFLHLPEGLLQDTAVSFCLQPMAASLFSLQDDIAGSRYIFPAPNF